MLADYFSRADVRALLASSDFGGAIALLHAELSHESRDAEFHKVIGVLRLHAGENEEALRELRQAEHLAPRDAEIKRLLGQLLISLGRTSEALVALAASLRLDPDSEEGFFNTGLACQLMEKWEASIPFFQRCLEFNPSSTRARLNLANAHCLTGAAEEARRLYLQVLETEPQNTAALGGVGSTLQRLNQPSEAADWHRRALQLRPRDFQHLCNLGNTFLEQNQPGEALTHYREAHAAAPDRHEVANSIAIAHLTQGELAEGWRWMHRRMELQYPSLRTRHWDGSRTDTPKDLLVLSEQGLGDTLFFLRYLPQVAALGYRVSILAQSALKSLLTAQPWLHAVYGPEDRLPAFDCYSAIMSLPWLLEASLKGSIPALEQPLRIPDAASRKASVLLKGAAGPSIGLTWAGNPKHQNDHNRSRSLAEFLALLPAPLDRTYCLQKQWSAADHTELSRYPGLVNLGPELSDFSLTAALVSRMNLVITVDTAVAHLAGLLNVPVWIMLPHWPDWRWGLHGERSVWYSNARLFRQERAGTWADVDSTIAGLLGAGG